MQRIDDILDFWFGSADGPITGQLPEDQPSMWFSGGPQVDETIEERFGEDIEKALDGAYDDWADNPSGRLALILLLDQFTRNVYRGTAQAFSGDPKALSLTLDGLDQRQDVELDPIGRVFFYMPLEHAEELGHQQRCVDLMKSLTNEVDDPRRALFKGFYDYAIDHQDIIERFGRFPHRNPLLDRPSTDEEEQFLADNDTNFGQPAS